MDEILGKVFNLFLTLIWPTLGSAVAAYVAKWLHAATRAKHLEIIMDLVRDVVEEIEQLREGVDMPPKGPERDAINMDHETLAKEMLQERLTILGIKIPIAFESAIRSAIRATVRAFKHSPTSQDAPPEGNSPE